MLVARDSEGPFAPRPKRSAPRGRLSSPAPILLRLALHRRRIRVLEFQPILRPIGAVARPEPLRHDAFESHLAGVPEYALAVVGEVLVQTQPRKAPTQEARERRLARLQRFAPQVLAIQFEEVEGVKEDMLARRLAPQPLEHREPVLIAGDRLAI